MLSIMGQVHVVAYDPQWPALFETLRARVWPAVHGLARGIEHVGSTSVPGLAAKPVIDMDIIIADDAPMRPVVERLGAMGYTHRGDLGIVGREAFRAPAEQPAHHLYVCRESNMSLANHLAVRDHLRTHPETAAQYGALKQQLAREFPHDMLSYVAGKTDLLLNILRQAGFPAEELQAIARANRP
jgi:GrpB-like predicted nucleotidyltransferase (UPF0157 family)